MRALVIALFLILGLFASSYYVCKICEECCVAEAVAEPLGDMGLKKGDAYALSGYEEFKFAENDNNPILTENNNKFLEDVANYLKENPEHKLKLTGDYLANEESPDSYDNMGVSRAAKIRDLLVAKGFSTERFSLHGEELPEGASLDKPLAFEVIMPVVTDGAGTDTDKEEEPAIVNVVQSIDDRTYYFEYGKADFVPSEPFIRYMEEVKAYLAQDANKDKMVYVIGHTDNKGTLSLNKRLSANRAKQVRSYIIKNGVSSKKIKSESKWYSEPAATNDTDAGRAKNRRVQIRIK